MARYREETVRRKRENRRDIVSQLRPVWSRAAVLYAPTIFHRFDYPHEVFIGYPRGTPLNNRIIDNRYRRNGARKTKILVDEEINYEKETDIPRINSIRFFLSML